MTRRILILLFVASLCFAVFIIGVSAADGPSGTAVYLNEYGRSTSVSLGSTVQASGTFRNTSLTLVAPSAGVMTVSLSPSGTKYVKTGNGSATDVTYSLQYNSGTRSATVTVTFGSSGSAGIAVESESGTRANSLNFSLVSWEPSASPDPDPPAPDPYPSSGSRWVLADDKGNWVAGESGQQFLSTSNSWQTYSQYIGEYITKVKYDRDGTQTEENSDAFMSRMLANLAYNTWDWSVSGGKLIFFPPEDAEGSFLDNMWRMNVTLYYNLVNNSGWFGMVTSNQSSIISQLSTLNTRVLQILSVLANDEDVKIKDATTDHRNWIIDFFQGENTGKPTVSDNDAVNDSMNTVKNQFQSSYTVGDIGSIFSGYSYDNNIWYNFWSQPVFNDVNGIGRGGFGGGKAPARSPAASKPSWSSQYSYDDDSIPDISGFGGGLSD